MGHAEEIVLEQVEGLSPKEITLLKHVISSGHKSDRTVSLSLKSTCKDLQLDDLELFDTLVSLSVKGFIKLLRFPPSEPMRNELRKQFLQMDMLSTVLDDKESKERRDRITGMISVIEASDSALVKMTTLEELVSLSHDLDEVIRELADRAEEKSIDNNPDKKNGRTEQGSRNRLLTRVQTKLDKCLADFWERLELMKEESQARAVVPTDNTPRIIVVKNIGEHEQEKPSMLRSGDVQKSRTICLLLAIRAEALARNIAPPELKEELEELEARALIEEITHEAYLAKRKELEGKIAQSRVVLVSPGKIENLKARLRKRIDDTNMLTSKGIVSETVGEKIVESSKQDLERIEQNIPTELSDFCVAPSGDFLDATGSGQGD